MKSIRISSYPGSLYSIYVTEGLDGFVGSVTNNHVIEVDLETSYLAVLTCGMQNH